MNCLVTKEKNELLTASRSFSALLFEVRGLNGNGIRLVFNPGWGRLRRSRIFSRWRRWRGILIERNRIFQGYSPGSLAMRMTYLIRTAFGRHWYTVSDVCDRRVQLKPPTFSTYFTSINLAMDLAYILKSSCPSAVSSSSRQVSYLSMSRL